MEQAESYARETGYVNVRFVIGSGETNIHGKSLTNLPEALIHLNYERREEFEWFVSLGFRPAGILPGIYGENHHGIILVKQLT